MFNAIDLSSKNSQVISHADIEIARDLGLTSIEKYKRCTSQIQDEVDYLHKNQILTFGAFVQQF